MLISAGTFLERFPKRPPGAMMAGWTARTETARSRGARRSARWARSGPRPRSRSGPMAHPPASSSPEMIAGPFFVDEQLNRSDISGGARGTPLRLGFGVFRAGGGRLHAARGSARRPLARRRERQLLGRCIRAHARADVSARLSSERTRRRGVVHHRLSGLVPHSLRARARHGAHVLVRAQRHPHVHLAALLAGSGNGRGARGSGLRRARPARHDQRARRVLRPPHARRRSRPCAATATPARSRWASRSRPFASPRSP